MDYQAIIAAIVTGILGIGAVSVWIIKVMPKISGWITLAKDAVETINDVSLALNPDVNGKIELTTEEINKIKADALLFKAQLNLLLGKK